MPMKSGVEAVSSLWPAAGPRGTATAVDGGEKPPRNRSAGWMVAAEAAANAERASVVRNMAFIGGLSLRR